MAKNYVQEGMTIPITNSGAEVITSGDPVVIGDIVAVALVDIGPAVTGDGLAEGVFLLPKLAADIIPAGKKVFLKAGKIQLASTDAVAAGCAWASAAASETVIAVKING
ncbi:DUF2190 domain-containing protein [Yersinia kristensenii]|uniref:DUF2190 family protein n=1 Tax=Yersinia rochesterensis TaxID=1604335 RepID=A0A386HGR0_9GAMM|nr:MULTISPECIES: capsid cement protein [Yersinia]AYD44760.1 DUF2190 family protein [Yersinia rochesterensis]PEH53417.1 recombinase RecA [Yersinia kristensenii]PJG64189.1 DUF2190 domain-containing protein [Yersinia kristensenii]SUP67176.1 Uncharacterized conserved protein [Yersinia kristensenii]